MSRRNMHTTKHYEPTTLHLQNKVEEFVYNDFTSYIMDTAT